MLSWVWNANGQVSVWLLPDAVSFVSCMLQFIIRQVNFCSVYGNAAIRRIVQ